MLRNLIGALFGASALVVAAPAALAQSEYPNKPIRLIVTFPPGGSTDGVVRMLTPRLVEKLGQQVLVDNRPGAGGNIGLSQVAKAPATATPSASGRPVRCRPIPACTTRCPSMSQRTSSR